MTDVDRQTTTVIPSDQPDPLKFMIALIAVFALLVIATTLLDHTTSIRAPHNVPATEITSISTARGAV